jgi:SAM-dependent methyltransferase
MDRSVEPEEARAFYDREYRSGRYPSPTDALEHFAFALIKGFVERYELQDKRCLEIGCGRGAFQDLVADYTGLDLSGAVQEHLHKPFTHGAATSLPFSDGEFDAIWTVAVLEHIPNPERALSEMRRVLRPGGLLLLSPAWQCRSWAARGYPVRPFSDFDWKGKLIKLSIPVRNSVLVRSFRVFPSRVLRLLQWMVKRSPTSFRYRQLVPNYEQFWMADSDAVNAMDSFEAILWFTSRGDRCITYPGSWSQLFVRTGGIVFRIKPGK